MSEIDYDLLREKLNEAIADIVSEYEEESVLISQWVLVFEGIHEDNKKSLSVLSSNAAGESLPPWSSKGLIHWSYENYNFFDDFEIDENEIDDDEDFM